MNIIIAKINLPILSKIGIETKTVAETKNTATLKIGRKSYNQLTKFLSENKVNLYSFISKEII